MNRDATVLIIGAGLSGLTTAFELQKLGIDFLIVEGRQRIGGRILTHRVDGVSSIEMGATWFGEKHTYLVNLVKELDVPFLPQYVGERVLYDFANPQRTVQRIELPPVLEPSYLFSKGSDSLLEALCASLPKDRLALGERVFSISRDGNEFDVQSLKGLFKAKIIVNSMAPNLSSSTITFDPPLPKEVHQLSKATHTWMGESAKVGLVFKEAFWRERQIGTFYSQFGPIQELHDHMNSDKELPLLKGFLHPQAKAMKRHQLEKGIADQLTYYFQDDRAIPEKIIVNDWQEEDFTFHPYDGYVSPHQHNGHPLLRAPLFNGRYFMVGSETARSFPGYMDGAVERAKEVVDEISLIYELVK